MVAHKSKKRNAYVGEVLSNAMDKTVVVGVKSLVAHSQYKRVVRRLSKFKAHDEENRCQVGDRVKIIETRPLSREKRWKVLEILETAK